MYSDNSIAESGKLHGEFLEYLKKMSGFWQGVLAIENNHIHYFKSRPAARIYPFNEKHDRLFDHIEFRMNFIESYVWLNPFKNELPEDIQKEVVDLFKSIFPD